MFLGNGTGTGGSNTIAGREMLFSGERLRGGGGSRVKEGVCVSYLTDSSWVGRDLGSCPASVCAT